MSIKADAVALLEEAVAQLEKPKGSVAAAVQQIRRAAAMVEDTDTLIWCAIQLAEEPYISHCRAIAAALQAAMLNTADEKAGEKVRSLTAEARKQGIDYDSHLSTGELVVKTDKAGGGYVSIAFVEEKHGELLRSKRGNDGTYYLTHLLTHLTHVRTEAHKRASKLLVTLKYTDAPRTAFDVLKEAIDDRLLDLNPQIAEQLMHTFQAVASPKPESWSHALTSCRRLMESLADALYPPREESAGSRKLGKEQYLNRLWAFMDQTILSESNKEMAKAHVDFLGAWLEKSQKLANKGVHADLGRIEAVKAVFHTYLVIGDILDYFPSKARRSVKPSINQASLDELESLLGVSRALAKEVVKLRVKDGTLTPEMVGAIPGIGTKTVALAKEAFSFGKE